MVNFEPCPFCGGDKQQLVNTAAMPINGYKHVQCDCGAKGAPRLKERDATNDWNERPAPKSKVMDFNDFMANIAPTMQCIKTGVRIHLNNYNEYAHCDAFRIGDMYAFRIISSSLTGEETDEHVHFSVMNCDQWWDRGRRVSTLISSSVTSLGD